VAVKRETKRAREERLAARRARDAERRESKRAEARAEAQAREERLAARRARDAERREAARAEARAREERLAARRTRDAARREERRAAVAQAAAIAAAQAEAAARAQAREVRLAARRVRDAERRAKLRREKSLEPLANAPLGFEAAHGFADGTLDGRIAQLAGDDLPGAWDSVEARAAELLKGKAGAWVRIGVFGKKRTRKRRGNPYDESTPAASLAGIAPGSTGIWSGWRRVGASRKRTKFTTLATAILAGREIAQRMLEKKFRKLNFVLDYSTRAERPPE